MQIIISEEAVKWYKDELDITDSTYVRFHVRYGGMGGNVPGFSLGLSMRYPKQMHTSVEVNSMTFYIEQADVWYFEDKDLIITLDEHLNEPQFTYEVA